MQECSACIGGLTFTKPSTLFAKFGRLSLVKWFQMLVWEFGGDLDSPVRVYGFLDDLK